MHRNFLQPRIASSRRNGYSLIEMLIVLGILVSLTSFIAPTLRGPLEKSRLRSAARDVRSALGKTRSFAIRRGCRVEFRYEQNGRRWEIRQTADSPFSKTSRDSDDFETRAEMAERQSGYQHSNRRRFAEDTFSDPERTTEDSSTVLRSGSLPDTIRFAAAKPQAEDSNARSRSLPSERSVEDTLQALGTTSLTDWSAPIEFDSTGSSPRDQQLQIISERGFEITVSLRGLTGTVSWSQPRRRAINASTLEGDFTDEVDQ